MDIARKAHIEDIKGGAHISACGRYRYHLWRSWGPGGGSSAGEAPLFVMLNPSTADATADDATIRKCRGFSERWGFKCLTVVNVFAYRATDPADLFTADEPIGPDNDKAIISAVQSHRLIVAAWGACGWKGWRHRFERVRNLLGPHVACLGKTKDGHPRHPLYVPYAKALEPLSPRYSEAKGGAVYPGLTPAAHQEGDPK